MIICKYKYQKNLQKLKKYLLLVIFGVQLLYNHTLELQYISLIKNGNFLLDLCHFPRQHTAIQTQELLLKVLEDNNIAEKLLGITMDNAKSIIAADNEFKKKLKTIGNNEFIFQCYAAHIINISV